MKRALIFLALALASCEQNGPSSQLFDSPNANATFDVNDVSILWPLPEKREDLNQLVNLDGTGFLSKENFDRLMDIGVIEDDPSYEFWRMKYWYIIATRFDSCAKVLPTDATCEYELRLVVQPMAHFSDKALASDNALHLLYSLSSEQAGQVAKKLYELKTQNSTVSTNGEPLDIHPIMAAEGLNGAFAQGMKELVTTYARNANLKEATAMLRLNAEHWRFVRALPDAAQVLEIAAIPFVEGPQQTLFGSRRQGASGIYNEILPIGLHPDSLNEAADSDEVDEGSFYKLLEARQNELLQAAYRIDNPLRHTPSTIDCVSCHMASRVIARVKGQPALYANDGNPDRYVPPMPMTMTNITENSEITMGYTSRAFGYGIMTPRGASVSQRVINDSARIASDLNTNYLPNF